MGAAASLQLRQEMAHVRLDRLLGQEEPLTDLAVDETVGDELEDLDLAPRRLLLMFAQRRREREDRGTSAVTSAPRGSRLEAAAVTHISSHDLLALSCVHGSGIGLRRTAL